MNTPTFVVTVPAVRAPLRRSAVLGRPLASRIAVSQTRRAFLLVVACAPSDPPAEGDTESAAEVPVTDESSAVEAVETVADDTASGPVAESAAEEVVAGADDPASDQGDEKDSDAKPEQKRRRRRSRKREVTLPLEEMTVGMELDGTVKSVTDYGAFIGDMGTPTDGLLHVSQLAAGFVENVRDVVKVGDKVKVRVLSVDVGKGNFSLTKKTAEEIEAGSQPRGNRKEASKEAAAAKREALNRRWDEFTFDPEVFVDAKVMSVTDFGGFCQLVDENGAPLDSCPTDGLIHISELSKDRVSKVSDILTEGQIVKVRVTSTDRKRNRISMSLRPANEARSDEHTSASFAADMAEAEKNQPTFKTAFELAFETARGSSSK